MQRTQSFCFGTCVKTFVLLVVISLLASSCAQVVSPGGGPRDVKPPRVVKYIPDSAQLNFNSKTIVINFDEYIQMKDLNNQLIISPPLDKTPDVKVKNKMLIIDFEGQQLKPNTTYALNFGNAIQDMNEGNPIDNFKYIFSTGNSIDSLTVSGKVQNAFDHKTEKDILVMLYSDFNDSAVYKKQPDYFTKTKTDGTFQINNVRQGNYKIVALKDMNANYKYDLETESIGFYDDTVYALQKKNIAIDLFQEPPKKVFLKKYIHEQYGKITLVFNQGNDSIKITPINANLKSDQVLFDWSDNKDTLHYWFNDLDKDSLKLLVSNRNTILDTIEIRLIKKEDALKSRRNPLKLSFLNGFQEQRFDLSQELILHFNHPIAQQSKDKQISIKQDTIEFMPGKHFFMCNYLKTKTSLCYRDSFALEDPNHAGTTIIAPVNVFLSEWKENVSYSLFISPGTFTDVFGLTNDSISMRFKTREEKYYGSLKLTVNIPETQGLWIVQLLDEKENIVRENYIQKSGTITYEHLHPNIYKLKIIEDISGNLKWNTGNYLQKQQPEKVIYYNGTINVRSNWDMDLEWKTSP